MHRRALASSFPLIVAAVVVVIISVLWIHGRHV